MTRTGPLRWAGIVASAAAGIAVVGVSYRQAAVGEQAGTYYVTFWLGLLLAVLPVSALVAGRSTRRVERLWAVGLLGLLTAVPKYLRNPTDPIYHDEYAHWRQAQDVLTTGHLFHPNPLIPIVQYFPGTSAMTAALERVSGLSTWSSGELLVAVLHVSSLYAVYVLAAAHLRDDRAAGIAALVYAVNPSALYFDTQYAYESVAVSLFLWTLALGSMAARSSTVTARHRYTAAALLLAAACVVTHHLSTVALLVVLLLIAVVHAVRARRVTAGAARPDPRAVWWTLGGGTAVMAGLWFAFVARPTFAYLTPYIGGSVGQLSHIAGSGTGGRTVLAVSVEPLWERGFTALAPLLVLVLCIQCLRVLRARGRAQATAASTLALVVFGLLYIPSVPFILAPSGAEGARRSWAFTYLGVALVVALVSTTSSTAATSRAGDPALTDALGRLAARLRRRVAAHRTVRMPALLRRPAVGATAPVLALLAVLLIGNTGGGLNDPYRFPGPFQWGTDTRSASPEARTVAELLARQAAPVRVLADRYTALAITGYGGLVVAQSYGAFPIWQLFEETSPPSRTLVDDVVYSHYDYLVVDTRVYSEPAFNGDNFGTGDPFGSGPVPVAGLTYLEHAPWAAEIMATQHLRVFRLDFAAAGGLG